MCVPMTTQSKKQARLQDRTYELAASSCLLLPGSSIAPDKAGPSSQSPELLAPSASRAAAFSMLQGAEIGWLASSAACPATSPLFCPLPAMACCSDPTCALNFMICSGRLTVLMTIQVANQGLHHDDS